MTINTAAESNLGRLIEQIDEILPQTQCTRCGYPACRPYAEAIAKGEADINQCPPGGQAGIIKLATLLRREIKFLNPANGVEGPVRLAFIDEPACIGCTLCIQACPVDAIVGASKQMHTVIAELCTGCELCIPPCPVDCIEMASAPQHLELWTTGRAAQARSRYQARNQRIASERAKRNARLETRNSESDNETAQKRRAIVQAAIERAQAMKAGMKPKNTDNLPPEVEKKMQEIDRRRAALTATPPKGDES